MTLEDGFKMLKKPERLNPDPKQRMYFWYGHEQALLLDKAKVSATDIKTALAGKAPKPPFCYGRKDTQYGEVNSCGPEVAKVLCEAFKELAGKKD